MNKIYYLATCSTCQRIIKELEPLAKFELQNIREEKITPQQLDDVSKVVGSYEALFSRKSMKFRSMGLHEQTLNEKDYRQLILQEDTFLKRPVIIVDKKVFVGNAKKTIEEVKAVLTH
ncbi:MAG: arsenate reductase family protein [Bacteroidia bacterium]